MVAVDVVLPVLDEARVIPWVLARIPPGYNPIVVDNGSIDGSAQIAADLGAAVVRQPLRGFGSACFAGLTAATADVVCFMDSDGSLDPQDLPRVAGPVADGRADLSLGARRTIGFNDWPLHARIANRALAFEIRRRTGVRLTDIGPMRAAHRTELLQLGIRDRRSAWPLEMVLRAAHAGWHVVEVPVPYGRRRAGRSKVTGTVRGTARAVYDMARVMR